MRNIRKQGTAERIRRLCRSALSLALLLPLLPAAALGAGECPSPAAAAASLEKAFMKKVDVKRVQSSPVDGMCEVVVSVGGRHSVVYSDKTGRFLLTGRLVDSVQKKDLSRETLAEFNKLSPGDMEKVRSLAALTMGKGSREVFFVTDPQ